MDSLFYLIGFLTMSVSVNGELVPVGGGDSVPLLQATLSIGRRESCDICLEFPNISGRHCELSFRDGYWSIRDLNSANGTKINGHRIDPRSPRPLKPGTELAIGKRKYTIEYATTPEVQKKLEGMDIQEESVFGTSLLEKAGLLNQRSGDAERAKRGYDLLED